MALYGHNIDIQIRPPNKEPEWSSICNNVFDQYLDTADLFGLEPDPHERSSSNDSANLFDFSTGSEQSHQTAGTSPIPSWKHGSTNVIPGAEAVMSIEARQPIAKEPLNFWAKTLRALEQNAAACERQQRLRTVKSNPDFLSLGGCPSPPALPSSPIDQSLSTQRRRSRHNKAANGRQASQARSLSRGRPSVAAGVTKCIAGIANPYATVRKASASPSKMMTPSRFSARASGFRDVWAQRAERSPKKYDLRVSLQALPASPPSSARLPTQAVHHGDDHAAFGNSPTFVPLPAPPYTAGCDDPLSPLTSTFQHAHIHTPVASPSAIALNAAAHTNNAYFGDVVPLVQPNLYAVTQNLAVNDIVPLFPERTSSLAASKIQSFDFGFSSSPDLEAFCSTAPFVEPVPASYSANSLSFMDPFRGDDSVLQSTETGGLPLNGLGISCDPTLVSGFATLPPTVYPGGLPSSSTPYSRPVQQAHGAFTMPNIPHHQRSMSHLHSLTPSPPPSSTTRKSRAASASHNRRSSRHRRTKSASSSHRHAGSYHGSPEKGSGGFVNFTPQDSNKILSGVAPSGSSKTKARREKEAADKRRRISQAAVRAVVEAGGDLDRLAEAGLLG
ncbi:hypothetical protein BAUCODRAFT_38119 [Baudoinia panamericana UAMH 10762]|uniref:Developmental regulatory protein wetA n=1 Tax=Baudoinia panamericana (strain UAMH 10762) TaxID=717646 RepID=M2MZK1_BAUPA|nr:uncharacterized protein BAUCODRAFT_38119 [Baudoinia panamericana UAMH 10762]EMC92094.1 hypothetical protein BAUCODRAFT_38119 [Baudoinia panamericana UAMH 10762]